jgi:hypothetical protein
MTGCNGSNAKILTSLLIVRFYGQHCGPADTAISIRHVSERYVFLISPRLESPCYIIY